MFLSQAAYHACPLDVLPIQPPLTRKEQNDMKGHRLEVEEMFP
jgi:hypothetical protein